MRNFIIACVVFIFSGPVAAGTLYQWEGEQEYWDQYSVKRQTPFSLKINTSGLVTVEYQDFEELGVLPSYEADFEFTNIFFPHSWEIFEHPVQVQFTASENVAGMKIEDVDWDQILVSVLVETPRYPALENGIVDINSFQRYPSGDANMDEEFTSADLVNVFQGEKYETDISASWNEGDWNADTLFSSSDMIDAFQANEYEISARNAVAMPEPSTLALLLIGALPLLLYRRLK